MPERSGGTTVRGTEVTGTNTMPMPMPAIGSTQAKVREADLRDSTAPVARMPPAGQKEPTVMGTRAPMRATQGPVTSEAAIRPAAMGTKVDRGLEGRRIGHDLEVQRGEEEDGEGAEVGREGHEVRSQHGAPPEEPEVQHRVCDDDAPPRRRPRALRADSANRPTIHGLA